MVSFETVRKAEQRIAGNAGNEYIRSPLFNSRIFDSRVSSKVGRRIKVVFKAEHLQPVGSFKIRGALNFALSLDPQVLRQGLVTHSSGNHGIAVASVGRYLKVPVKVIVPSNAAREKIFLIESYGAEVILCEPNMESRISTCLQLVRERGMTEVPPYNHEWTMSGQGTLALELIEQEPDIDAIIVSVGGCGMISGVIKAAKGVNPAIKVYGAEPFAADDTLSSLRDGYRRGPTDSNASTICDALRASPPGELCWDVVSKECDGVFGASDSQTTGAIRLILGDLKQMVEPSGAIATAVLLSDAFVERLVEEVHIRKIAVVLCGGNIGVDLWKSML